MGLSCPFFYFLGQSRVWIGWSMYLTDDPLMEAGERMYGIGHSQNFPSIVTSYEHPRPWLVAHLGFSVERSGSEVAYLQYTDSVTVHFGVL